MKKIFIILSLFIILAGLPAGLLVYTVPIIITEVLSPLFDIFLTKISGEEM